MKQSSTSVKGVYKRLRSGKYEATVRFPVNRNNMQYKFHIGTFDTLEEAVEARFNFINNLL